MLVHHSHYARNIESMSLVQVIAGQEGAELFPVHRLDHKTSGALLLARRKEDVASFQKLFAGKELQKTYTALLRGYVKEEGIIDSPVKNERGNYKEALTRYRCLKRFELNIAVQPYRTARYSLTEFYPETGRMHQLRIHANKISHPIIGDPKYGNRHHNHLFSQQFDLPYLFLHASGLRFPHPFTGELLHVEAPLPEFWQSFFELSSVWKFA